MRDTIRIPLGGRTGTSARVLLAGALAAGLVACGNGTEPSDSGGQASADSAPASAPASTYRLTNGGKTLVDAAGTQFQVDPKRVTGYVDSAALTDEAIGMSGWAAPTDLSGPANVVVAIVGKKSVAAVTPSGERPDLVEGYDRPGLAKAGYAINVLKSSLDCAAPSNGLTTFAIVGDAAARLKWLSDVPELVADAC